MRARGAVVRALPSPKPPAELSVRLPLSSLSRQVANAWTPALSNSQIEGGGKPLGSGPLQSSLNKGEGCFSIKSGSFGAGIVTKTRLRTQKGQPSSKSRDTPFCAGMCQCVKSRGD